MNFIDYEIENDLFRIYWEFKESGIPLITDMCIHSSDGELLPAQSLQFEITENLIQDISRKVREDSKKKVN